MASYRIDRGTLRPAQKLADGRVRLDGYLTRTGVFTYMNADGSIRREYRSPDEVFDVEALASFSMVPVTNDHPPQHIDSTTAKQFAVGMTGESVKQEGDHVRASLMIFDAATVAAMDAGKVELSCGYAVDVVNTPGVSPEGEAYDAVQRKIRGNHVALVDCGRAGPTARVRMDGGSECAIMVPPATRTDGVNPMDELQKMLASALTSAGNEKVRADKAEADLTAANAALAAEKARADLAAGECAAEKARADKAEAARSDADASIGARVAARVALETAAVAALGAQLAPGLTDREIKVAVIQKVDGVATAADRSDDYVDGHFNAAIARADKAGDALASARAAAESTHKDAGLDPEALAAKKMREASAVAWKESN